MDGHVVRLLFLALALLLAAVDAKKDKSPSLRRWMPMVLERFGLLEEVAKLEERMDPEAELWVQQLEPLLVPRYVGTPAHEHVRQHIVDTLTAIGWTVDGNKTFQMQTPVGVKNFTNIVASHHAPSERKLVLACHYDSIFGRDRFVAATDSAVPCAMMLYLAVLMTSRYLNPTKGRSPVSLQLMFLDGEEAFVHWTDQDSIYGSRHLAETMSTSAMDSIDLFVLLDLLGAANPKISNYQQASDEQFKHLASVEEKLLNRGLLSPDVPRVFEFKEKFGVWGRPQISDDHLPFLRRGVKILHLIPHPFPSVWHEDSDDAMAVHYPTIHRLNTVLRVFVAEALQVASYL